MNVFQHWSGSGNAGAKDANDLSAFRRGLFVMEK